MLRKVNLLKFRLSNFNFNFKFSYINITKNFQSFHSNEIQNAYEFLNNRTFKLIQTKIKNFTKKANKNKNDDSKNSVNNKKNIKTSNSKEQSNRRKSKITEDADSEEPLEIEEKISRNTENSEIKVSRVNIDETQNNEKNNQNVSFESDILRCMIIHPVFNDSKGKNIELYLAEEAIGLGKSLDWEIIPGPFNRNNDFGDANPYSLNIEEAKKALEMHKNKYRKYKSFLENPENGDYVQLGEMKGIYYNKGIVASSTDDESDNATDEWKNLNIREELALTAICSVKNIKSSTFFSKGRLSEIGNFLRQSAVDVLFINTNLSVIQRRNLEITFNNYMNEENERIRAYNIKSALKQDGDATETESNFSTAEAANVLYKETKKIQVLDRFNIILSIFARRAKSKISQIQIELAYLKYTKAKLNRGGHADFSGIYNEFKGNIYGNLHTLDFEVVSGKQSAGRGSVGGSGETQLELEKRKIATREALLREELKKFEDKRKIERESRRNNSIINPTIGLVGYTNAGKTALMNILSNQSFESENKLFQTLNTTLKKTHLLNNQEVVLVDTIGFITDLPHELVDSFKSTLEEVFYSDILLHVIDVSNPSFQYQRKVVYKVLDEIFPKDKINSEYENRIIEVWNKIDLLKDVNMLNEYISDNKFPIVPISAKRNINLKNLIFEIGTKINSLTGKELRELRIKMDKYDKLSLWIKENCGRPLETNFDHETEEMVVKVNMNKDQYDTYMENFVIMRENKKRKDQAFLNKKLGNLKKE